MSLYSRVRAAVKVLIFGESGIKPGGRYCYLLQVAKQKDPRTVLEVGVWRGDRSEQFLKTLPRLERFVGFDLFEGMDDERFEHERMGKCSPCSMEQVEQRLRGKARSKSCSIELIKGPTQETLPKFLDDNKGNFDFIFMDGGHSIETVRNDWYYCERLLAPGGIIVLDDYLLNDSSAGVKTLVDELIEGGGYNIRFFPMIEKGLEDLQLTMVSIKKCTSE